MLLYHGTCDTFLPSILGSGLRGREEGMEGNWEKVPSRIGRVYLTDAYPAYFAASAYLNQPDKQANMLILEIDTACLDQERFYPDEDFIGQATIKEFNRDLSQEDKVGLLEYTRLIDLEVWKDHWKTSLEGMGTCSYKGVIPASAITKYALVDPRNGLLLTRALDPTISIMNYRFCGEGYREFTKYLMTGKPWTGEFGLAEALGHIKDKSESSAQLNSYLEEAWKEAVKIGRT